MVMIIITDMHNYGKASQIKFLKIFIGQICDTHMFAYQLEWNPVNLVPNGPQNQNINLYIIISRITVFWPTVYQQFFITCSGGLPLGRAFCQLFHPSNLAD